jgi:membrane-bound lytic murein transglycosylase MltF
MARMLRHLALALATVLLAGGLAPPATAQETVAPSTAQDLSDAPDTDEDLLIAHLSTSWTGDLTGILQRGFLRIGAAYNPVMFTYDGPKQQGSVVDLSQAMEAHLRKALGKPARNLTIVIAALPRDGMIDALEAGRVDMLMANLTVTPERQARVDFTNPIAVAIREVLVTGPSAPPIAALDDLAEIALHLRPSSSYFEHMTVLNAARVAAGAAPIQVKPMDENMEDGDVLELVGAGALPAAIIDAHMAGLYAQIIEGLTVHDDLATHEGGEIAWALRKNSPELMAALNGFMKTAKQGTLLGNTIIKRYLVNPKRVSNAMARDPSDEVSAAFKLIETYAQEYDFEALLIAAQGYQESHLDQKKRSKAGAIGIMQVMPATAKDPVVAIPDIHVAENNVKAGVKYLRFLRDRYFSDPEMTAFDQTLFSFAAYNAGPGNIRKARRRAEKMGLNPNVWFGQTELATARAVSREPVIYVRNILKYYVTYKIYAARVAETAQ